MQSGGVGGEVLCRDVCTCGWSLRSVAPKRFVRAGGRQTTMQRLFPCQHAPEAYPEARGEMRQATKENSHVVLRPPKGGRQACLRSPVRWMGMSPLSRRPQTRLSTPPESIRCRRACPACPACPSRSRGEERRERSRRGRLRYRVRSALIPENIYAANWGNSFLK